jgi:LacI family transcriptional regulator
MKTPHTETPRAKPTVVDVAIAADVAVGTVSRVLNTPELVGADIRQRVIEAVERLDYSPLRRRRRRVDRSRQRAAHRGNVGVLFLGTPENHTELPVFADALRAMERLVATGNENLMRASVPAADRVPLFMTRGLVDGLILRGPGLGDLRDNATPEFLEAIERHPQVWLVSRPERARGDLVGSDHEAGAMIAADYLERKGHRRIVYFDPRPATRQTLDAGGVLAAFARLRGLEVRIQRPPEAKHEIGWPIESRATKDQVLPLVESWSGAKAGERPTVVVVPSDDVAFQLFAAFHGRNVTVGRDVSVFSLRHERGLVAGILPRLASLDIQAEEIGRRAVDQLRWRLEHAGDRPAVSIGIRPKLIEGDSVANLA